FDTYNRTDDAERIQYVVTALAWLAHRARGAGSARRIRVVARGRAGGWALLGAQMAAVGAELDVRVAGRLDLPCADLLAPPRLFAGARGDRPPSAGMR
ncbi:MAG: hypothetical protein HZA54_05810, partial [Planctomycetes bacterium]|nr:hypothetical protein [Planctomycetota bacterium]